MEKIKQQLKALCEADGVSGNEWEAAALAAEFLREYAPDARVDHFGNAVGRIASADPEAETLLLDAHIDEIGMIVTSIDDKGFLKVSKCGGIDRRLLPAQMVTVHGKEKLTGIIGSKPPHLEKADERSKVPELDDIYIDIGLNKEQAEEKVSLGDRVTFRGPFTELLGGRVTAKAIDDRAGVAAILHALELLKGEDLGLNLAVQFTSREEIGGQGATIAAYNAGNEGRVDCSIAVDVSFAYTPDAEKHRCGKLGGGAMIGYAAALDKSMSDRLVSVAKEKEIPYSVEAMGGRSTGTNSDEIYIVREGARAGLISIPLRYMHTPVETVQLSDIEAVGRLIAEFVRAAGK